MFKQIPSFFRSFSNRLRVWLDSKWVEYVFFVGTLIWFLYQLLYFSNHIGIAIAPDEPYHLAVAALWSKSSSFFLADPQQVDLGAVHRAPYFFHFLGGLALRANIFGFSEIILLRTLSVFFSTLSLFFSWRFYAAITKNRLVICAALIIQTNILMYVFIGSMYNYDSLVNCLATAFFWVVALLAGEMSLIFMLWLLTITAFGCLVKVTFLPLVPLSLLIIVALGWRHLVVPEYWAAILKKKRNWGLIVLLVTLGALNLRLYGANLLTYGEIDPSCETVYGDQLCISKNLPSKAHQEMINRNLHGPRLDFFDYFSDYWVSVKSQILGITGHKTLFPNRTRYATKIRDFNFGLLFALILRCLLDRSFFDRRRGMLLFAVFFYMTIVIGQNFHSYLAIGSFGAGLQGRYLFPILIPAIGLASAVLLERLNPILQSMLFLWVAVVFAGRGFIFFLSHVPANWFL